MFGWIDPVNREDPNTLLPIRELLGLTPELSQGRIVPCHQDIIGREDAAPIGLIRHVAMPQLPVQQRRTVVEAVAGQASIACSRYIHFLFLEHKPRVLAVLARYKQHSRRLSINVRTFDTQLNEQLLVYVDGFLLIFGYTSETYQYGEERVYLCFDSELSGRERGMQMRPNSLVLFCSEVFTLTMGKVLHDDLGRCQN